MEIIRPELEADLSPPSNTEVRTPRTSHYVDLGTKLCYCQVFYYKDICEL